MIKNKKIIAFAIGASIMANSMGMVFADGNDGEIRTLPANEAENPAIVTELNPDTDTVSTDVMLYTSTFADDPILQKQSEIDKYLFEEHKDEIAQKGFTVTHTVPFQNKIEIGIKPYSEANADYLYEVFGKDTVSVVAGENPEIMQTTMAVSDQPEQKEPSKIAAFFAGIWEWIKNIF